VIHKGHADGCLAHVNQALKRSCRVRDEITRSEVEKGVIVMAVEPLLCLSSPEASGEERIQHIEVGIHLELSSPVFGDLERRTKGVVLTAEEMGRALHSSFLSLVPIVDYRSFVTGIDGIDTVSAGNVSEHIGSRDVEALFEQGITESKTDRFACLQRLFERSVSDCQRRKRGVGKVLGVEATEEIRGNLHSQVTNMMSRSCRVQWCSIDEFERPSPNVEECVLASQGSSAVGDTSEPYVRR
jgi:hypothetical protein